MTRATAAPAPSVLLVRRVFLALLGAVAAIAFLSLWVQLQGLVGQGGILPGCAFLERAHAELGGEVWWTLPGVFLLHCSDAALQGACALGVALSLLLMAGVAPSLAAAGIWLLYLSLSAVGNLFLSYQWDILLLESSFLAIFLAPRVWRPRDLWRTRVPRSALWLLRWLVFRLFFLSGAVKLLSGDPTWRDLTALQYHYFTQPIPAWTSWYAYQLPALFQSASVAVMFVIELVLPFAALGPRLLRAAAAAGMVLLQVLIGLTGNYGFFNLLAASLCVTLLDDALLRRLVPARWRGGLPQVDESALPAPQPGARTAGAVLAAAVLLLTSVSFAQRLGARIDPPDPLGSALDAVRSLRSFNAYGLFAVMTTERPEILLEGSADGRDWQPYTFRWKPGPPDRAPAFVEPHMPRLDWQMWFAALRGRCQPWFQRFMLRLLEGAPDVVALLADDPFPETPPRYLRARLQRYRFTSFGSDAWWEVEAAGSYCPTVRLQGGRLVLASPP